MAKSSRWIKDSFETHQIPLHVPDDFVRGWNERFFDGQSEATIRLVRVASQLALTTAICEEDGSKRGVELFRATAYDMALAEHTREEFPESLPVAVSFSESLKVELQRRRDTGKKGWAVAGKATVDRLCRDMARRMGPSPSQEGNAAFFVDRMNHERADTLKALPVYTYRKKQSFDAEELEASHTQPHPNVKEAIKEGGGYLALTPKEGEAGKWRICRSGELAQRVMFQSHDGRKTIFQPNWDLTKFAPDEIRAMWTKDLWEKIKTPVRDGGRRQH